MSKWVFLLLPVIVLGLGIKQLQESAEIGFSLLLKPIEVGGSQKQLKEVVVSLDSSQEALSRGVELREKNPFRMPSSMRSPGGLGAARISKPIIRVQYRLKGTVGNQAATIEDERGRKTIVRLGGMVDDSTSVLEISPARVTLKDGHGTFFIDAEN